MSKSHIAERFQHVCRDRASDVAVRDLSDRATITFETLFEHYQSMQRAFSAAGIGRGSLVVSLVGNRPIFFPLLVACLDAGATLLPLGETTTAEAVALLERSGAAAIVTDRALPVDAASATAVPGGARLLCLRPSSLSRSGQLPLVHTRGRQPADPRPPKGERYIGAETRTLAQAEPAVLKLTSGSTELPRVAVATEAHLVNDGRHVIEAMAIGSHDVNLAYIPLSHSYALGNIVVPLVWQGTAVVLRQSFAPAHFVEDVESSGATVFPGVPFMFERLATLPLAAIPQGLRLLISAGAPIGLPTVRWFSERLARKIHSFYGSSETGGITYDDSDTVDERVHVGTPMPETTIAIHRDGDEPHGRVFVTGNAVTSGYAGADQADAAFVDGGFLSTDLGYLDAAGRLVLTGRVSSLVNVAGRKVDPAEVERVLRAFPEILDVRVLGAACDHRGQQLAAVIVRRDRALTAAAIRQQCAEVLSAYKIPRRFVFLDELPVDARGKVDRRTLEALVDAEDDT